MVLHLNVNHLNVSAPLVFKSQQHPQTMHCFLNEHSEKNCCYLCIVFGPLGEQWVMAAFAGEHLHADTLPAADHRLPSVHVHPQCLPHGHSLGRGPRRLPQCSQIW